MTSYIVKSLLIVLTLIFVGRGVLNFFKTLGNTSGGKYKITAISFLTIALSVIMVIFLTLFEVILCLVLFIAVFLFRKNLSKILKEISLKKYGKVKAAGSIFVSIFALWFWLAVFYRTDIGMPIGVQNYLYHKYGEEFDVNGFFGATIAGHPTNRLTCCPKNGSPAEDSFNVVRKNTLSIGSRRFASDNYYGIIIRDDYERYISTYIDDYFDDFSVNVHFDFSGLSNTKYMSDEFDKKTSLEEFLDFQLNEDNIRACNFAFVDIYLKNQPDVIEKEIIKQKTLNLFNDLTKQYSYLRVYIMGSENNSEYITGLISYDSQFIEYRISDNFFKSEE